MGRGEDRAVSVAGVGGRFLVAQGVVQRGAVWRGEGGSHGKGQGSVSRAWPHKPVWEGGEGGSCGWGVGNVLLEGWEGHGCNHSVFVRHN